MEIQLLCKYHDNLNYVKSKRSKSDVTIHSLIKNAQLRGDNFIERFRETSLIILENIHLFQSVCNHQDVAITINDYIYSFIRTLIQYKHNDVPFEKYKYEIWTLMLSLFNYCRKQEVHHFLETFLIKNSSADSSLYREYKKLLSRQTFEVILLEESDLYTVISSLKTSESCRYINKIWVKLPIKCNFLSLKDQYLKNLHSAIFTFQSKQELFTPRTFNKINVTSIWSEDITAARSLAASLDRDVVLINTLDLFDSIVSMPYVEIFKVPLFKYLELDEDQHIINMIEPISSAIDVSPEESGISVYSLLFYDGMWQNPVENNYWIHKRTLKANATREDIGKCVVSAKKGFKIWSRWSTESRMQVLCKFASALEHIGKTKWSETVYKWSKFPHWYEGSRVHQYPGNSTMLKIRKPKGVITLMEKDVTNLLIKLTQSLIIGNSVIVICTKRSCNLVQCCDMFSASGIPAGVVNMLSCENVKPLSENYDATELREIYHQFTVCKQVVTPIIL